MSTSSLPSSDLPSEGVGLTRGGVGGAKVRPPLLARKVVTGKVVVFGGQMRQGQLTRGMPGSWQLWRSNQSLPALVRAVKMKILGANFPFPA
eukprot:1117197-Heterocapsa_arctica.AAC.1